MNLEEIFKETGFAVTVCDKDAKIVYMNDKAKKTFERFGTDLVGKCLFDCHKPESVKKIQALLESGKCNDYTIEKAGVKKIIHQCPWYEKGMVAGLVELSIEIPVEMPHFVR